MAKSIIVSTLILFFTAILEASIFSNISFFIVVPDFLLICSIYFSLLNGKFYVYKVINISLFTHEITVSI